MTAFLPSAEQRGIVEAVKGPIAEILPLSRLHEACEGERGRFRQLAELGCFGIGLDEDCGGAGLTAVEEALLFEQLGRQLASPSVLACVLAAHIAALAQDREAATEIASGERPVGLAISAAPEGQVLLLDAADHADLVLLGSGGPALLAAADLEERELLDAAQWGLPLEQARLHAASNQVAPTRAARARLLMAAQLAGIAAATRDMAVDYAKVREQFGKPIGGFQAVKHHCADMAMGAMAAADLLGFAAVAVAEHRPDAAFQVHAALSVAIRAARTNAAINVQVHGGMGFSDECDAHLFVKHAHVWETVAGGREAIHAALLGEPAPMQPAREPTR